MFFDGIFEKQHHVDFYHYRKFNSVKKPVFLLRNRLRLNGFHVSPSSFAEINPAAKPIGVRLINAGVSDKQFAHHFGCS